MAKIDTLEAEVRSKAQEALDEFVQKAKELEGHPEFDSDILSVQIKVMGTLSPRNPTAGSAALVVKRDVKP